MTFPFGTILCLWNIPSSRFCFPKAGLGNAIDVLFCSEIASAPNKTRKFALIYME